MGFKQWISTMRGLRYTLSVYKTFYMFLKCSVYSKIVYSVKKKQIVPIMSKSMHLTNNYLDI